MLAEDYGDEPFYPIHKHIDPLPLNVNYPVVTPLPGPFFPLTPLWHRYFLIGLGILCIFAVVYYNRMGSF